MAKAKRTPRTAKKSHMTAKEYRAALMTLGISVTASQHFFGCSESSAFRRSNGQGPITFETAALLRVMVKFGIAPNQVSALVHKPRYAPRS